MEVFVQNFSIYCIFWLPSVTDHFNPNNQFPDQICYSDTLPANLICCLPPRFTGSGWSARLPRSTWSSLDGETSGTLPSSTSRWPPSRRRRSRRQGDCDDMYLYTMFLRLCSQCYDDKMPVFSDDICILYNLLPSEIQSCK